MLTASGGDYVSRVFYLRVGLASLSDFGLGGGG